MLAGVVLFSSALTGCRFDPRADGGDASGSPVGSASPTAVPTLAIVTPTVVVPGASPPPGATLVPTPAVNPDTYVVADGDTLYAIALKFGVELADLIEVNGLSDPNDIKVGQELKIPPRP